MDESVNKKDKPYNLNSMKNHKKESKALFSPKLLSEKKKHLNENNFENNIKKLFSPNKFILRNDYDYKGSKDFLNEKNECLKPIFFDDVIKEGKSRKLKKLKKAPSIDFIQYSTIIGNRSNKNLDSSSKESAKDILNLMNKIFIS